MPDYVETGTQTKWAGLMQRETVRPDTLLSPPPETTTPPDDMLTDKPQFMYGGVVPATPPQQPQQDDQTTPLASTLLDRRQNRAHLDAHIALPPASADVDSEVVYSPPPTHAVLSPVPEANKRHAGHTPLYPRALSPELVAAQTLAKQQVVEQPPIVDGNATPDQDEGLTGALTLPANPVDGAEDYIGLDALDHRLGKIAKQQAILRGEFDDDDQDLKPKPDVKVEVSESSENGQPLSRKESAESRRSAATEEVDGVILKTPPSNFGAPLGQL